MGGSYCAAQTCNANSKGNPGLSFFTFPKDPSRCKLWVQNVGRQDLKEKDSSALSRNYTLCANHFKPNMFMNAQDRKRLVWNAVPTVFKRITRASTRCVKSKKVTATLPQKTSSCQAHSFTPSKDSQDEKTSLSSEEKEEESERVDFNPRQYHDNCISPADNVSDRDLKTNGSSSVPGCHDHAKVPLFESATGCPDHTKTSRIADAEPAEENKSMKEEGSSNKSEDIPTQEQIEQGITTEEALIGEKLESLQKAVTPLLKRGKIKKVLTIDRGKVKSIMDMSSGKLKTVTGAKALQTIAPILHQGKIKKIMAVKTEQIASIVKKITTNQLTIDESLIKVKHRNSSKSSEHVKLMGARNLGLQNFSVPEDTLSKSKSSSAKNEDSINLIPSSSPLHTGVAITPKPTPALQKTKVSLSESYIKSEKLTPEAAKIFPKNSFKTSPLVTFEKQVVDKERLKTYTRLIQKHKQRSHRMKKKYDNLVIKLAGFQDVGKPTQILRDSAKYLTEYQLLLLGYQLYMSNVQVNGRRYSPMIEGDVNRVFYNHPVAYNFLGKILSLPPDRAIKSWMRTAAKGPGFDEDLFELLKERTEKMEDDDRVCTLQFSGIPFDSKLEQEDDGNFTVGTKALFFMIRGMKTDWTQLISYFLLTNETCSVDVLYDIIINCLWKLDKINIKVKAIVCDESDITRAVYHQFGAHPEAPYFFQGESKIHCLYNPTQLLISTRDALKDHDILVGKKMAKWNHINEFYQRDVKMKIRLAPQLSCQHIAARERVKTGVKMAAQTLSRTVAAGLCTHASLESLPAEAIDTANFIKKIDSLFDLFNSQPEYGNKKFQKGFQGDQTEMTFLKDSVEWINRWQAVGAVGKTKSQEGWLQTITGLIGLWEDLQNQHDFKILFTRRLNLDSIDAFFNLVRKKSLLEKTPYPTTKHLMDSFRYSAVTSLKQIAYDDRCFEELAKKIMENCAQSYSDHLNGDTQPFDSHYDEKKSSVLNNAGLTCVNTEASCSHEPVKELITVSQDQCANSHCVSTSVETFDPQNMGDLLQKQNKNGLCVTKADTKYTDFPPITQESPENALEESMPTIDEMLAVVTLPSHISNSVSEDLKSHRVLAIPEPHELVNTELPVCHHSSNPNQQHITDGAVNIIEPLDFVISKSSHPVDNLKNEVKHDMNRLNPAVLVTLETSTENITSLPSQGEPMISDTNPLGTSVHRTVTQVSPSAKSGELTSLSAASDIPVSTHSSNSSSGNHEMSDAGNERDVSLTKTKKRGRVKRLGSQRSIKMIRERKKLLQDLKKMLKVTKRL